MYGIVLPGQPRSCSISLDENNLTLNMLDRIGLEVFLSEKAFKSTQSLDIASRPTCSGVARVAAASSASSTPSASATGLAARRALPPPSTTATGAAMPPTPKTSRSPRPASRAASTRFVWFWTRMSVQLLLTERSWNWNYYDLIYSDPCSSLSSRLLKFNSNLVSLNHSIRNLRILHRIRCSMDLLW